MAFSEGNGYSLSDVAAVTRGNDGFGFGGDGFGALIWLVVIIALLGGGFGNGFGFGGFGNGGAGLNSALTRGELCQDMNFQDLQNGVRGVQQSISDGFALQNVNFTDRLDNVSTQIATGFDAVNLALVRDGYETRNAAQQNMIANMQNTYQLNDSIKDCCCNMQSNFAALAAQSASENCAMQNLIQNVGRDITDNANANTKAIIDFLVNDKISDLQSENQTLRLQASQQEQNNYLVNTLRPCAVPAYITCNPYTSSYGIGMNNCCGCGA